MNLADFIRNGGVCDLIARDDALDREPAERIYQDPVDGSWSPAGCFMNMALDGEPEDWRGEAHWSEEYRKVEAFVRAVGESETDRLAIDMRQDRDAAIQGVEWMKVRHADQITLGQTPTLDEAAYAALLTYIQALRDVTAQPGFPHEIEWPVLDLDAA